MQKTRSDPRLAVLLVAAGTALACGTAADPARAHGTLVPRACPSAAPRDARCSTLFVWENRQSRAGRVIPLSIVVLPARAPTREPDPVFFLAGGPGQAASVMIRDPLATGWLRDVRDMVFADQRGTGGSNALTCEFYGPPDRAQSYFEPFLPPDRVRECRERLAGKADLTQYTTSASVDDLDDVRAALGYERINLIGGSYGSRLAMEYVRRHETRVRSVVLEGVAAPALHVPETFGLHAQRALDRLLEECAADAACHGAFPGIRDRARAVFARLAEGPVRATVAHPADGRRVEVIVTRSNVAEAVRYMMYTSHEASRLPLALHEASEGRYGPIAQSLLRRRAQGTFDGVYLSITCAEDVPFMSADAERREAGTFMDGYRVREQRAACEAWPRGPAPAWIGRPVSAKVPALLVSGDLDPATPPEEAEVVASTLPNSLHLRVPYGGHSPAGLTGLDCLQELRTRFVDRASAAGLDTACLGAISRPGFVLSAADR